MSPLRRQLGFTRISLLGIFPIDVIETSSWYAILKGFASYCCQATSSGQHKQKTGPSAYFLQFMYTGLSDAVVEHLVDMRCQEHVTQLLSLLLHPGPNGEAAIAESIKSLKDRTAT